MYIVNKSLRVLFIHKDKKIYLYKNQVQYQNGDLHLFFFVFKHWSPALHTPVQSVYNSQRSITITLAWCLLCLVTSAVNPAFSLSLYGDWSSQSTPAVLKVQIWCNKSENSTLTASTPLDRLAPRQPGFHFHQYFSFYFDQCFFLSLIIVFCIYIPISSFTTRSEDSINGGQYKVLQHFWSR